MSLRFGSLYNDGYYHIFNRGVDRRVIFNNESDFEYFLLLLRILNSTEKINSIYRLRERGVLEQALEEIESKHTPLVEIYGYSLLDNHFHLVLKQVQDNGISLFMQKLGSAYTQHFNAQENRRGTLWESKYKYIRIENDFHLIKMISYVNRNHTIHRLKPVYPITSGYEMIVSDSNEIKHFKTDEVLKLFNDFPDQSLSIVQDIIEQRNNRDYTSDMID